MSTSRLEAFSDGVIAIVIIIMVLELHTPGSASLWDVLHMAPKFIAYFLSFLVVAIYWNNHHHLMKAAPKISAGVMWANMHLLFWLSLIPFATAWLGESDNYLLRDPVLVYSTVALFSGIAYYFLSRSIIKTNPEAAITEKIGKDHKGVISLVIYIAAILVAFYLPVLSLILIAGTAVIWFIPDRRLEALLD